MVTPAERSLQRLLDIWDGAIIAPAALEHAVETLDDTDASLTRKLVSAAEEDLSDVRAKLASLQGMPDSQALLLARRLGWTVDAFTESKIRTSKAWLRFEAALASVAIWDEAGAFWNVMRPRFAGQRFILPLFKIVFEMRGVQALIPDDAPFWEKTCYAALAVAEDAEDWPELAKRSGAFERLPRIDPGARQAALALVALDWPALIEIADKTTSWLQAHSRLSSLSLVDALRLASASTSGPLRFAALDRVTSRERRSLSASEEIACRNLLIVLSRDREGWPRWLAAFNRYPVRFRNIQGALGHALAWGDVQGFKAYVDSIELDAIPASSDKTGMRDRVTDCLSIFRSAAGRDRRLALWRAAYERWKDWNFGAGGGKGSVEPARSALDYGAVGWLVEGPAQRTPHQLDEDFEADLRNLDLEWHLSLGAAVSKFFALVSSYHLHAHAISLPNDEAGWSPGVDIRRPPVVDDFVRHRFRWIDRSAGAS